MRDLEGELRVQLDREADRVTGVPRGFSARVAQRTQRRPGAWLLRLAPAALAIVFLATLGLPLLHQRHPAPPAARPAAVASAGPTVAAVASPAAEPKPSPSPLPDLGPFACGTNAGGGSAAAAGTLRALRVAHQQGFDRITFEFAGRGVPSYTLTRQGATRFYQDASGMPVDVQGSNGIKVVFHGASERDAAGNQAYAGSNDVMLAAGPGAANAVAEVRQVGDFERVLSWAVGLSVRPACTRVLELDSPSRLVIDVQPQS